jgi:hypothetical protein
MYIVVPAGDKQQTGYTTKSCEGQSTNPGSTLPRETIVNGSSLRP